MPSVSYDGTLLTPVTHNPEMARRTAPIIMAAIVVIVLSVFVMPMMSTASSVQLVEPLSQERRQLLLFLLEIGGQMLKNVVEVLRLNEFADVFRTKGDAELAQQRSKLLDKLIQINPTKRIRSKAAVVIVVVVVAFLRNFLFLLFCELRR
jgi:hypothetical protein